MAEETTIKDRRFQHRVAMACGAALGVALFSYLALAQNIIRGFPYGPFWWTNLVLGVVVFGCVGGLGMVLLYMSLRHGQISEDR